MRDSARRRRAAEIISIARVIFWTFLTEATRLLSSFAAMGYAAAGAASSSSVFSSDDAAARRSSTSISSSTGLPSSSRS